MAFHTGVSLHVCGCRSPGATLDLGENLRAVQRKPKTKGLLGLHKPVQTRSTQQNQLLNSVVVDDEFLSIQWKDGNIDEFPHIYLRENCSKYQNPITKGRIISPLDLDMNVVPKHVYIDSNVLNVIWNDDHTSLFTTEELQLLRHKPQTQETEILANHVKFWGDLTSFKNKAMPVFDYQRLMENDYTLYQWLVELAFKTGIAKIENIPVEKLQLQKLGNRVGYLVSTNYGIIHDVKTHSRDNATDIGYTSAELQLHTDYTFTYHQPMVTDDFYKLLASSSENSYIDKNLYQFHALGSLIFEIIHQKDSFTKPCTFEL
ncbi:gamma-butyrobetaine dioxygenase-like isoform X2 [Xenia sp. Carnegie-2017]|uniref:gamma-butyrobetaine dioxygenase-like isoform X2 n=1 Tax=Xenia sp. Carnegie-2017 TaxID=2897299 RepID=UPI001F038C68|nr:gamma-butyrobetaine dioxygenase-like isoform X2 [Xenia sp. Carnegie-2017]